MNAPVLEIAPTTPAETAIFAFMDSRSIVRDPVLLARIAEPDPPSVRSDRVTLPTPERLIAVLADPLPRVVMVAGLLVLLLVMVRFLFVTFNWALKLAPLSKIKEPLLSIRLTSDGVAI